MIRNRIIKAPETAVCAINDGIIVRDTMAFCTRKAGLIWMPESDRKDFDTELEIGEVISVGGNVPVDHIQVGDIVLYRRLTAYWLPNGIQSPCLWKLEHPISVVVVLASGKEAFQAVAEAPEDVPPPPLNIPPGLLFDMSEDLTGLLNGS